MPVVELSIDSSGATAGLSRYDSAVAKSAGTTDTAFSKIRGGVASVGAAFAGIATAGVAAATASFVAFAAALASAGAKAAEIENLARLAGEGVVNFQNLAYATDKYGISAESLADISKDVQDKLGDFIQTGAGEFADFFENVAPKVGLTASALAELSGPDALIAVKNAMDEVNLSAAEQTFYLESLGNDLSLLAPLLANNGELWRQGAIHASNLGLALSKVDTANLKKGATALTDLTKMVVALKDKIVADLAPAFTLMVEEIQKSFEATGTTVDSLAETISGALLDGVSKSVEAARFLHNGFLGIELVLKGIIVVIGDIIGAWGELTGMMSALLEKVGLENPFKAMGEAAVDFKLSAREAFTEQLQKIDEVNQAYDKTKLAVDKVITKTKELSSETADVADEAEKVKDRVVDTDTKERELKAQVENTTTAIQYQQQAQVGMTDEVNATAAAYERASAAAAEIEKEFTGKYNKDGSESTGNWDMRGGSTATGSISAHGNTLTDEEWQALPQWQQDVLTQSTAPSSSYYYHTQGSGKFKGGVDQELNAGITAGLFQQMNETTANHSANVESMGGVVNTFNFTESVSRSDIESIVQDATRLSERA